MENKPVKVGESVQDKVVKGIYACPNCLRLLIQDTPHDVDECIRTYVPSEINEYEWDEKD